MTINPQQTVDEHNLMLMNANELRECTEHASNTGLSAVVSKQAPTEKTAELKPCNLKLSDYNKKKDSISKVSFKNLK